MTTTNRRRLAGAGAALALLVAAFATITISSNGPTAVDAQVASPAFRSPAGVWVILQLASASQAPTSQTGTALATSGVVGYGPRVPVNLILNSSCAVNLSVLDTHRAYSLARGKLFKPRIIWGRYTPTCAMGTRISGFAGPAPYLANGAPNTAFEAAYKKVLDAEAAWAANKPDVVELDCGWYSLDYSELYNGPEVQHPYGLSTSQAETFFIAAHKRLIDIALASATPVGVPVGFGLSGHGPIGNITKGLAAYGATKTLGSIYMQANGWGQDGEWGGALESTHDANVWVAQRGKLAVGLQDISAPSGRSAANVTKMWDNARSLQSSGVLLVYVEQYAYQWDNGGGRFHSNAAAFAEFKRQIGLFAPSVLPGAPTSTAPPTSPPPSPTTATPTPPPTDAQRLTLIRGCVDDDATTDAQKVACVEAALAA